MFVCFLRGRPLVIVQNGRYPPTGKGGRYIQRIIHFMNSVVLYQSGLFCIHTTEVGLVFLYFIWYESYPIFYLDSIEHCIYSFDTVFSKDF